MPGKHLLIATLVLLGVGGGALAGFEASATVDDFYTAPREPKYRAIETPSSSSSWDTENRTFAAAPPPGMIWGGEVGRDERAFFDAGAVEREEPVRVQRATVRTVEPTEPVFEEPVAPEPVEEWAQDDPERLPSAG